MKNLENKKAIFLDNNGELQEAIIYYVPGQIISIETFNKNQNKTGYINLYFHHNNRIFLDAIYCYDEFRSSGIAKKISDLADYLLKDYIGYIIRGSYEPSQLSTDRENGIIRSQDELDIRATVFYRSCGYSIISYPEYLKEPDNYPEINIRDDFQLGEEIVDKIVVKKVEPELVYDFNEIDGILVNKNVLNLDWSKEGLTLKNDISNFCTDICEKSLK